MHFAIWMLNPSTHHKYKPTDIAKENVMITKPTAAILFMALLLKKPPEM